MGSLQRLFELRVLVGEGLHYCLSTCGQILHDLLQPFWSHRGNTISQFLHVRVIDGAEYQIGSDLRDQFCEWRNREQIDEVLGAFLAACLISRSRIHHHIVTTDRDIILDDLCYRILLIERREFGNSILANDSLHPSRLVVIVRIPRQHDPPRMGNR